MRAVINWERWVEMEEDSAPPAVSPPWGFLYFVEDTVTPSAWHLAQLRHSTEQEGSCGGHTGHFEKWVCCTQRLDLLQCWTITSDCHICKWPLLTPLILILYFFSANAFKENTRICVRSRLMLSFTAADSFGEWTNGKEIIRANFHMPSFFSVARNTYTIKK